MKKLLLTWLCLLPFLAVAQSVTVPNTLDFAGLHLRFTPGGRTAVQQKVDALRRYQPSFQARVDLADAYFPIIDRVFQAEGLPQDFHYLALQESGLQGEAQSIHDAIGYWQFKREAALDFGLVMNDVVDERKHIVASSHAAAKYLLRNNAALHNWANTLLSYNLGLSGTKPYTLPTDANASEMEISEQTHPYILTFLAHKIAFESAVGQNPKPPMILQEFPALAGQQLPVIAQSLQTDPNELAKHNRWLLNGAAIPSDRAYTVLVPITDEIQLTAIAAQQRTATAGQLLNQPQIDPENAEFVRINGLRAIVALPGDTKETLAKRAKLKMRKFMQFNDLFAFDNIVVGQPYFVQKKRDKAAVEYHVAQSGESVATVSQKYGVRAKAIFNKNRMARNEDLRVGRVLWLQHTRPRDVAVEYAEGKNEVAMAAFERPAAAQTPAPTSVAKPAKSRTAEAEPYKGRVSSQSRALEEASDSDSLATESVAAPTDSVNDAGMENLNDLPNAAPAQTQPAPQQANARVYSGQPASKPAPAPVAAEPATEISMDTTAAAVPAVVDTTAKVEPVVKDNPKIVLRDPAPAKAPVAMPKPAAATASASPQPSSVVVPAAAVEPLPANGIHIVQKSESLYSVARRYGIRPADLAAWNDLPANPSLRLGQTLRVTPPVAAAAAAAPVSPTPKPATPATPAPSPKPASGASTPAPTAVTTVRHTVAAGESMYGISRKYGVTIKQIMEWNGKPDFNVHPGEVLTIQVAK
ncbi:LysM peptidoglycan-binding domain-containing protein [Hymenobacter jejuensis]|nr:LysM peptidoglycan-binding domain-containing protein [Hymenobacter jejuensis]